MKPCKEPGAGGHRACRSPPVAVAGRRRRRGPAGPATAGTYKAYMCQDGYGTAASRTAGLERRQGSTPPPTAPSRAARRQGRRSAGLEREAPAAPRSRRIRLDAPAGTSITGLIHRNVQLVRRWVAHWATSEGGGGDPTGDCGTTQDCTQGTLSDSGTLADSSYSVPNASLIGFGLWCDASTCAQNSSDSLFGPAGSANVLNAAVTINEPNPPSLSITRFPTGWISNENAAGRGWMVIRVRRAIPGGCVT